MVFFNYTTMQVSAKIVYYGPGLCGKTTNLHQIHSRTDPDSRGEMVSLETEADRTLFFDLLPLEVGTIGGMRVRLQLYTVPGQVFYNTTRKLVLKGVDGIVFVADSQEVALEANIESFHNLKQNLDELNQSIDTTPFIYQYNKRDLRHILSAEALDRQLNHDGFDVVEAAALHGIGVFETLKIISKKTLAAVHRKISGDREAPANLEVRNDPPPRATSTPAATSSEPVEKRVSPVPPPPPRQPRRPSATTEKEDVALPSEPPTVLAQTLDSAEPSRRDPVFAELEDDIEAEAMSSVTEELDVPPKPAQDELGAEASTGEVRIEFPMNPELTQDIARETIAAALNPTVPTKSRIDIERELSKLREMAFPAARPSGPSPVRARTLAKVPRAALAGASALEVALKLVGDQAAYEVKDACRIDLPSTGAPGRRRVRLEIDLVESDED